MKRIYFVRHAKAISISEGSDYARPLIEKGRMDAKKMGEYLGNHYDCPDALIASSAIRTKQTAEIIAQEWHIPHDKISYREDFYEDLTLQNFLSVIHQNDHKLSSIVVVGHNPWISYLVDQLSNNWCSSLSTSACAVLDFSINNWVDLSARTASLIEFQQIKDL